jgi:hypothetical protein
MTQWKSSKCIVIPDLSFWNSDYRCSIENESQHYALLSSRLRYRDYLLCPPFIVTLIPGRGNFCRTITHRIASTCDSPAASDSDHVRLSLKAKLFVDEGAFHASITLLAFAPRADLQIIRVTTKAAAFFMSD